MKTPIFLLITALLSLNALRADDFAPRSPQLSSSDREHLTEIIKSQKNPPGSLIIFRASARDGDALKLKPLFILDSINGLSDGVHSNKAEKISIEGRVRDKSVKGYFVEITLLSGDHWKTDQSTKPEKPKDKDEHLAIMNKGVLLTPGEFTQIHAASYFDIKDNRDALAERSLILAYLVK